MNNSQLIKKKLLLFLSLLSFSFLGYSNIIPTPSLIINEIHFNSNANWVIELKFWNPTPQNSQIDSTFLSSSSGKSKIKILVPKNGQGYIIITADSLYSELDINRLGDSLTITNYILVGQNTHEERRMFVFGNHENAFMPAPKEGESIGFIEHFGYISIPPSLGIENKTGLCGKLSGKLYDKEMNLITNGSFWLNQEFLITSDSTGSYQIELFQHDYYFDKIYYSYGSINNTTEIDPIEITIKPSDEINRDIIIKSTLLSIFHVNSEEHFVLIYPNPATQNSGIYITTNIPLNSTNFIYEMYNIRGIKVKEGEIKRNGMWIDLSPNLKDGNYFFRFKINGHIIQTSKLIFNRS